MASLYADKENRPFESTRVSSANLLHEQVMSSQMETDDDDMMETGEGEQSTLVGRDSDPRTHSFTMHSNNCFKEQQS